MTQEKKVIRVLKPAKKAKKTAPMFFGIIGTAFGVIATSVLLFTFLKEDTNSKNQYVENQTIESSTDRATNSTPSLAQNAPADITPTDDEHDGFNQPQPNVNEITNVFKHKNEAPATAAAVETNASSNGNPFDNFGQATPVKPVEILKKPPVIQKSITAKSTESPKPVIKPNPKAEQLSTRSIPKPKAVEKEAEYEVPHASVQIAVTRSVKE